MTAPEGGISLRFLFDEHVHAQAVAQLRSRGLDVVHVRDVSLLETDDAAIFEFARRHDRVLVTRNYQDFAPLVGEAVRRGVEFSGVLFLSPSLPQSDVGAHVRALQAWLAHASATGKNPVAGTYAWLR